MNDAPVRRPVPMNRRRWTAALERAWCADLERVLSCCFPGWRRADEVRLLFSNRRAPGVFAACDRPSLAIGLFPRAMAMGGVARMETLIHECCHLATKGMHGISWKNRMKKAAGLALEHGWSRLSAAIQRDIALYDRRRVSKEEVFRKLHHVLKHGERSDFRWVSSVVADWAGWPRAEFLRMHPWLREAWAAVLAL